MPCMDQVNHNNLPTSPPSTCVSLTLLLASCLLLASLPSQSVSFHSAYLEVHYADLISSIDSKDVKREELISRNFDANESMMKRGEGTARRDLETEQVEKRGTDIAVPLWETEAQETSKRDKDIAVPLWESASQETSKRDKNTRIQA